MEFRTRRRQRSPHYTIYLGFGQDLSAGRPKERSLVLVKVRRGPGGHRGEAWPPGPARLTVRPLQLEPWLCRVYLEGAQREGASSLDSGNLDLCLSSFNSLFEDLEHFLMDVEQAA